MDNMRKRPPKESNLNSTFFIKPSGLKHRPKVNETINFLEGPSADGGLGNSSKLKHSVKKPNFSLPPVPSSERVAKLSQFKLNFVYNEYLQTILKQSMVRRQTTENKVVLDRQLQYYSELLKQKEHTLREVHNKTELIKKQKEVVEVLKLFEEKLEKTKTFFIGHQVGAHMDVIKTILEKECDKVFLRNIKPFSTQEEYDKFLQTLRALLSTMEKIMNSGIDFEGIHNYAEEIRNFLQLQETVKNTQEELEKTEMDGIRMFISKLSDMFAKQYESKPNSNLS